jgi:hypothetical protein
MRASTATGRTTHEPSRALLHTGASGHTGRQQPTLVGMQLDCWSTRMLARAGTTGHGGASHTAVRRRRFKGVDARVTCMLDRAQLDGGGGSFRFKILCSFGDRIMPRQTDGAPNTSAARPVRRSIHFATRTASCFGREREKENCSDRNCKLHL